MTRWKMMTTLMICGVCTCGLGLVPESQPATQPAAPEINDATARFAYVDVTIDTGGESLAAYQFELTGDADRAMIVGVEGGEHTAFAEPPYYDPAALQQNRIIIAAFNTGDDLPKDKTRIARVHLQITGKPAKPFEAKLIVAGSPKGEPIDATIEVHEGDTQ